MFFEWNHLPTASQFILATDTWTSTDLLVMRVGCCRTRSSSRPSLSSSRLRAMSASWPMTPNASSRLRNMENSLCRCRVLTRIASVIRPVETRSSRVISAQGITNLTGGEKRVKYLSSKTDSTSQNPLCIRTTLRSFVVFPFCAQVRTFAHFSWTRVQIVNIKRLQKTYVCAATSFQFKTIKLHILGFFFLICFHNFSINVWISDP